MFTIPTQGKRVILRFGIRVHAQQDGKNLRIRGKSVASGCVYFDRDVQVVNDEAHEITLDFPLPISPEKLIVEFAGPATPLTLQTAYLWSLDEYSPVERAFFEFLKWFLPRACKLKPGIYDIPGTKYRLLYYKDDLIRFAPPPALPRKKQAVCGSEFAETVNAEPAGRNLAF